MELTNTRDAINKIIEENPDLYGVKLVKYEPGVEATFEGCIGLWDRPIELTLEAKNINDLYDKIAEYSYNFDADYEVTDLVQDGEFPFGDPNYPRTVGELLKDYQKEEFLWRNLSNAIYYNQEKLQSVEIQEVADILNKHYSTDICEALPEDFVKEKANEAKENKILENMEAILEDKYGSQRDARSIFLGDLQYKLEDFRERLDDEEIFKATAENFIDGNEKEIAELDGATHRMPGSKEKNELSVLLANITHKELSIAYDNIKEQYVKNKVAEYCMFEDTKKTCAEVLMDKLDKGDLSDNEKFDELADKLTQEFLENSYYHSSNIVEEIQEDVEYLAEKYIEALER